MKKLFSLLLACMMLFLTSCNQTMPSENTTGNSQNQEQPQDTELKDTIIRNGFSDFIDIPSRVLFNSGYVFYYSKADGKAYVYCFDPLCEHKGKCLGSVLASDNTWDVELRSTFFINNRFYAVVSVGRIFSYAFDGSDLQIVYEDEAYTSENINYYLWSQNYRTYGKYIYIPTSLDENEKYNLLRFNTETYEMENLTEKTGNFMNPDFFYNGEIYGKGERYQGWYKADLDMKNMEPIEEPKMSNQFYGSAFFNNAYDSETYSPNQTVLGIKVYDMKTGETTILSNEMLGLPAYYYQVIALDENYLYFYQWEKIEIGKNQGNRPVNNNSGGKLYRVKHDGTECVCIFNDPSFDFIGREAVVTGNKIIIEGHSVGMRDGYADTWDSGMKVGTIGPDGKIEKFENIELVY